MSLPSDEQTALLWPIQAKGKVTRLNPLGDPQVEMYYHKAMEQGRFLEASIADANNWLIQKKTLLINQIQTYTHMNSLATDGQLPHAPRVPKYVADSISILQTAQKFQQEILGLVAAIEQNIQMIIAIEQSMLQMITNGENSPANLPYNICNCGLPALPPPPYLFSNGIWNWNGFQFSPLALFAALKSNTNFNFNFTLANCSLGSTAPSNLFLGDPVTITTDSGLTYSSPENYDPPLDGTQTDPTQDLNDPTFIAQMQGQNTPPIYNPNFNPNTEMYGAVPDPHQVISNYQMPAATYTADIVSICPLLRSNTVFTTDADYSNPDYTVREPELRKDLLHLINLAGIVQSNYDTFVMSAWLLYLAAARQGRGGVWIPNFEAVYQTYIQPSVSTLSTQSVPWNDVLPGTANILWMGTWDSTVSYVPNDVVVFSGVNYIALLANTGVEPDTNATDWGTPPADSVYSDAPVIPLIATFQGLPQNQLFHLLWQLSYIEASLLSYSRNSTWDTNQDTSYLTGPTGNALDYTATATTGTMSNFILGAGVAEFPVPITFPTVIKTVMDEVIAIATTNIDNDLTYLSPRLGNRYTYNQFAVATQVDRFSQFWRDFATNLTNFLAQDPYIVQFAVTYPDILDGALDPLASSVNLAAYASLLADVATRNRAWTPGTPLLNIPIAPVTGLTNSSTPTSANNGWVLPPTDLDPIAFLARPDISVLPIPMQTAMLRTNISYAAVATFSNQFQAEVATQIATAATAIASLALGIISATSIASNVLTVVSGNSFNVGDNVELFDTGETFLNGQTVTITSSSPTQFTADFTAADYSNPTDTGIAWGTTPTGANTEFITDVAIPSVLLEDQVAVQVQPNGHVNVILPNSILTVPSSTPAPVYFAPIPDGITNVEVAAAIGDQVILAMSYGDEFILDTAQSWTVGGLLYVNPVTNIVTLTQDFSSVLSQLATLSPAPATITGTAIGSILVDTGAQPITYTEITAPASPAAAPITYTNSTINTIPTGTTPISTNILTVTCNNTFAVGDYVLLEGTAEPELNGQVVVVLTQSATQFTCNFAGATYTNAVDTGTAAVATGWLVAVGRVIAYDGTNLTVTFIYEPHLPMLYPVRAASV